MRALVEVFVAAARAGAIDLSVDREVVLARIALADETDLDCRAAVFASCADPECRAVFAGVDDADLAGCLAWHHGAESRRLARA